jgi:hypothetical protein
MNSGQRRFPRRRPEQLVYVELGPQNGGMMLSVSEGGFSFRVVSPVQPQGTIHFAFAIDAKRRIEGDAELAWTDESGKMGGLRFVELSPECREQLHAWLAEKKAPAVAGKEVIPAAATPADTLETLRREIHEVPVRAAPAAAAESRAEAVPGPPVAEKKERLPAAEKEELQAIKWEEEPAEKKPPTHLSLGWAVAGMLFVLVVVLLAVGRRTVGESLILLGEQIAGETKPSNTTPAKQPVAAPKPVAGKEAAAEPVRANGPTVQTLPAAGGNGIVRGAVPPATSADTGPMVRATEQPGERGKEALSARADPVQLLWAAVKKGNTAAQVALAGFYLRGEGVTKNCSQARVLLATAAKKGNADAKQKLAQLEQEGCP